ncbi:PLxRFG domain-containing protein [Comamonas antarctica]|uniref:PLxRFG domain-containing protein n=1 Tax=Comamonas antarctica TaxID=2743470 RepID=UPI0028E3C40E|nr:PLxRFG domain-containing protein [Comamonas antarctica]
MAKKKQPPAVIASFDDLDAAGIGVGYKPVARAEASSPIQEEPKSRGLMAVANDTVIEAANAAAGGVAAAANFIKPGNSLSGWIDENIIKAGEASQSDQVKASKQKFRDEVAQADGVLDELGAVGGYLADSPLLAGAQALGSFVIPGAAIKGAGLAGRAAGLGAKGVQVSGRAGGVAAGAALAGGDAAGTAYELSTKAGATEEEAVAAARGASVIPALVGAAGGAFGAESLLAGARGFGGGMVARAAKTGLSEAAQEAVEEGVTQYEGQRAAMPFDASIDPTKGVAAAAGMGAALGGITGAGTSLLVGDRGREAPNALEAGIAAARGEPPSPVNGEQAQAALDSLAAGSASPEQLALLEQLQADRSGAHNVSPILDMDSLQRQGVTPAGVLDQAALARAGLGGAGPAAPAAPATVVPERRALSRAANLAAASAPPAAAPLTEAAQAQSAPVDLGTDGVTGEISPEARVGQIQERLDFLAQMGRNQGWTNDAIAQRQLLQQELDLLSPAQRMEDLQAQADAAEARAADWSGREYLPNPTELPGHAAQGGPVDIQEANEQRRLKNMQQAQQEAAAARGQAQQLENEGNAQAQLAAQEDRAGRLEPSAPAPALVPVAAPAAPAPASAAAAPGPAMAAPDILNRLGKPFTVKLAANKAAKEAGAGWEAVKVDGGFVARQVQPSTAVPAASTAPAAPAALPAPLDGAAQAQRIAREGAAQRQQRADAGRDAGARWDGMAPEEQRAVLAATPKLAPVLRKNLEGKAWEKISEGNRAKLSSAMAAPESMAGALGASTALAPTSLQEELGEGVGTFSEKLAAKIDDAQYKLAQGEGIAPAMRKINGADVPAMTAEVQRLESLREEAKALDATAQREDTARAMLKAARQELDASALNATGRTEAVARAGATGNAVDASQAIFDAVDSKTTPVPVEGADLGNGWAAFTPESGTKGVPRAQMPQIKAEHRGAMVNFMNARGIAHQEETVPAASLKPTQAEFDRAKVQKALGFQGGDRSILVSQDGHVLDGHHQWLAAREQGKDVKTIRLDAPIEQLLETAREFPSSTTSAGAAPANSASPAPAPAQAPSKPAARKSRTSQAAESEQARADYFAPGNIIKSYSGHDRVIGYTPPDAGGNWSVRVQAVQREGDAWVAVPNERERSHATPPDARALKSGPVHRAPAVESAPAAEPEALLVRHNSVEHGISAGTLKLEEYQQTFAAIMDEAAVMAELNRLTKDDLLRAGGAHFAYRYKGEKKDAIVKAAYNSMLHTYALGRQYGSSSFVMSAEGMRAHELAQSAALRELVANTTAEDLAARAAEIKAARDEFAAQRRAAASALENPKTLQDFRGFMRHWIEAGEAADAAFLRLTPEQRQAFDALEAESSREAREKAKANARSAGVRSAGSTTAGEIIATKHTKHGHDLFVVQLADRVAREDYETLNTSARRLGGSYSSFRGNGAIPGFQFRARESAEAFQQLVAGETAAAQGVAQARRDAFEDDRSQTAVERLRTMADAIDAGADEQLSVERKTNTARRARMAGAAEEAARGSKAYAGTMRNLADAIEAGKAPFLDGVRTKTQLTQLQQALGAAKAKQLHAKYGSWAAAEEHKHDPIDAQTVDFAEFPRFSMFRSDLAGLARQLLELDGGKKLGAGLSKVADDVTDAYTDWAKANLQQVSHFGRAGQMADFANRADAERAIKRSGLVGKAVVLAVKRGQNRVVLSPGEAMQRGLWQGDGDKRIYLSMDFVEDLAKLGKRRGSKALTIPWQLESTLEKRQRLQRMGIQTPAEYRSALRELAALREEKAAPDRIKELERSMVGRSNDGLDFFPTASAVTESAVDAADIQPGMEVLEPSAGMAHIADRIREQAGVEPDVVELSGKRRELLEAKGYNLVGSDFLEVTGKQYDRIVMNPPFSDGRDIQHVRHAFELLKPGGRVVAIMSESAFFQSNKRAEAFREWLDGLGATNEKLPDGSFMDPSLPVNTSVSARMVVIDKPGADGTSSADARPVDRAPGGLEAPATAAPTQSAAFENWFGDSKVVDAQGKPLVVYHGTRSDISTFALSENGESGAGIYMTDDADRASIYAGDGYKRGGNVMPVYASIKNPASRADVEAARELPELQRLTGNAERGDAVRRALESRGFDGVISVNPPEYVAFRPEQVKSAIGNNGEFDVSNPDIRFRRTDRESSAEASAVPGMTPEQAEQLLRIMGQAPQLSRAAQAQAVSTVRTTVDAIRAGWANGPEVTVVYDMADPAIPAAARRADQAQRSGGAEGDPEGFYLDGKVYLLASQLPTPQDAARVLMHEALGHHGLRGVFGSDLDAVLNQIVAVRRGDVRSKAAEYGLDYENPAQRLQAAEEVLAEWAQTRPEMGFVRRAVAAIRTWLRQHVPGLKRLAVTDAEIIRSYILPARGWVERGAGAGNVRNVAFSRSTGSTSLPDVIIGSTLGSASSHPDYAAAKGGDIEAAVRLAQHLVTPELVAKVRAAIGDAKPRVVPVAAEEAAGRNKIPRASAEVLAMRLGLEAATGIVQANRARRTGLDGLDRIFAPVDFAGAVEPGPYLLVDDTLTQGGTFAALASHIREGGGTVAGVIALTGKQYSATIQPSPETLAALRQKHGDLENEFRAATGYGFDALTQSEARYLARYEPADRLRDRILDEGRRGRQREDEGNPGPRTVSDGPLFSRAHLATLKHSALDQLGQALSHPGKVSLWDKTVGTMRHLAERSPAFRPVYESAQRNIDDVSMLANDAADQAPRILPRVDSMGDIVGKNRKRPLSAEDNKAVARPIFEGTLMWGRDVDGKPALVDDLVKKYANMAVYNKAAMLLRTGKLDAGVLAMWQGLPVQQYEKLIESRFESKILKAGVVWSDAELKSIFSASQNQISLYREARAAIDRSIDMTARADMLRALGDEYSPMRDAVLDHDSLAGAAQMLLDTMEQDAKAIPDNRDRLAELMQQVRKRLDAAQELQQAGYAPLSRFGRYTVDVVDAAGERQYFGMYETMREANMAARNFRQTFPGATVEQGTMSQQVFKLFAGVTPESLELFGNMLGLDSQGTEAQDKAFQEYLKLTKNNHSAMKRMIHRKGTAGFSQDVGRVVANFVYSNARQAAAGLNVGTLDKAINAIPRDQGELKDLAMGLRGYIQDPQEEGQAIRGMLFAQYLGGSLASAFVNMTQPFQVTLPWLSQHGGMKKAGAQLARALKDMGTQGFQYETDLAKALQSAEDDGVVSPQEIHQLMAQARGAGALRAGDGTAAGNARAAAGNAWERTKVAWGQPFALAEQFNRRSTFIASYRLAKEQGIKNPSAFARHAVLETQFVYSKANKPQWARGTIGGTLFTFKTYSVSYLELMQRMWTQGGAEGKRAVGWSMAMLMLMGGAGGLPFVEDVEDLIDAGGQMMGYSMAVKQWRKQLMQDVMGKELADFIEQGVSGLPGAPVDVSGRLGMGNLIPGTGMLLEKRDHSRDLLEVLGPAGDLIKRAGTGTRKVLTGEVVGGALEVSPTAVRNLAKGIDMADSGVYKDTKGRKVIDVTLAEAAAKAIGFQPKSVAEVQEATATEQNLIGQNRSMKERLTADMAQAVYDQDAEKQAEIRERMRTWNARNPDSPVTIDMLGVRRRVIKMRQTKAERVTAAAPKSIRANVRQSLAEAQAAPAAP